MIDLVRSGIILMIIGFTLVFIGIALSSEKAAVGGLIMIGPLPIAFGTSPGMTIAAMVIGLIFMVLFFLLWRKNA